MLTSFFCVCKLWVLPLKGDIWWNVETHKLISVMTEPKNMLIHHCELFPWFIFLAKCEIFNFVDVGRRLRNVLLHEWLLVCYQSNGLILQDMSIFLLKSFILSIFNSLSIVQKHFRLYNSCWLANIYQCLSSVVKHII